MKKIETITPAVCKEIREALEPVINKFIKENYGLDARVGSGNYTDKSFSLRLEIKAEGVSSLDKQYAELYGWPAIGTEFTNGGLKHTVVEYAPKKRSYPIITQAENGKRYQFPAESVNRILELDALRAKVGASSTSIKVN